MRRVLFGAALMAATFAGLGRSAAQVATDPKAPVPGAVVSTAWAAERIHSPVVVTLDVRGSASAYGEGHLPGAVYLNIESLRGTVGGVPEMLLPPEDLARRFGAVGISNDTHVLIYADKDNAKATYVALALDRLGHRSYAIMEGGYAKWVAEGCEVVRALPPVKPRHYSPDGATYAFTVDMPAVRDALKSRAATYIDTRGAAQFADAHVPRAINHPAADDVAGGNTPLWKPVAELKASYEAHGLTPDSPVIVGCRTGRSASHTYFTLRHILGYKSVRWYDGSMTEWLGRPYLPVKKEQQEQDKE